MYVSTIEVYIFSNGSIKKLLPLFSLTYFLSQSNWLAIMLSQDVNRVCCNSMCAWRYLNCDSVALPKIMEHVFLYCSNTLSSVDVYDVDTNSVTYVTTINWAFMLQYLGTGLLVPNLVYRLPWLFLCVSAIEPSEPTNSSQITSPLIILSWLGHPCWAELGFHS